MLGISLLLTLPYACGGDERAAAPAQGSAGNQKEDAGNSKDASSNRDGDTGSERDASTDADDGGDQQSYGFGAQDRWAIDIGKVERFNDQRGFDVAASPTEFAIVFENNDPASDTNCVSRIDAVHIPTKGEIAASTTAWLADLSNCSVATEPTVAWLDGSYTVLCSDNRSGREAVNSFPLGSSPSTGTTLTTVQDKERHPAIAVVASNRLAAWVAENPATGKQAIRTQLLGVSGSEPSVVTKEDEGRVPAELVLARIGTKNAVLGWVDWNESTRGIYLQALTADGTAEGEPQLLTDPSNVYSGSTLDIAGADNGGGAVFSIAIGDSKQVRFVRLDAQGRIKPASELKLVAPPRAQAKDASLVKWGSEQSNQYLIAYRAIAASDITAPEIRLTSLDLGSPWNPSRLTFLKLSDAMSDGGRVTLRMTNDGTALLAWVDLELTRRKTFRALRLQPQL